MSHTIGVVGHDSRRQLVDGLVEATRPDVVSIDDGTLGCEGNHRFVWRQLVDDYPYSRWTVVLEDDALPVPDFDTQLEAALRVAPAPIVSLYLGRLRPPDCQASIGALVGSQTDAHWFTASHLLHAVGVAIRTDLLPSLLDWLPRIELPIDEAITVWARHHRHQVAYTWPSLVDHADQPTVITQHRDRQLRGPGRVAWRTGVRPNWTGRVAPLALPRR